MPFPWTYRIGLIATIAFGGFTTAAASEVVRINWRLVNVEVAPEHQSYSLPMQMTFVMDEDRFTDIYNVTVTPGQVRRGVSRDGFGYAIRFDTVGNDAMRRIHIANTQTSGLRVDLEVQGGGECKAQIDYFVPRGRTRMSAWRGADHEHVILSQQSASDITCSID